jgi:hypothetical protein
MRVIENTPVSLKLRDRTLWIAIVCFFAAGSEIGSLAYGGEWSEFVPAAVSVAFGLAFLRATDVTFDKIRRICTVRRFDIIRMMRTQLAFGDIMDIRVEVFPGCGDSGTISCRLSLVTPSGVVPLTLGYEPDLSRYNAMRDTLLDALFEDKPRPAPADLVHDLVKAGRIIDAVQVLRLRDGLSLTAARARIKRSRR